MLSGIFDAPSLDFAKRSIPTVAQDLSADVRNSNRENGICCGPMPVDRLRVRVSSSLERDEGESDLLVTISAKCTPSQKQSYEIERDHRQQNQSKTLPEF